MLFACTLLLCLHNFKIDNDDSLYHYVHSHSNIFIIFLSDNTFVYRNLHSKETKQNDTYQTRLPVSDHCPCGSNSQRSSNDEDHSTGSIDQSPKKSYNGEHLKCHIHVINRFLRPRLIYLLKFCICNIFQKSYKNQSSGTRYSHGTVSLCKKV